VGGFAPLPAGDPKSQLPVEKSDTARSLFIPNGLFDFPLIRSNFGFLYLRLIALNYVLRGGQSVRLAPPRHFSPAPHRRAAQSKRGRCREEPIICQGDVRVASIRMENSSRFVDRFPRPPYADISYWRNGSLGNDDGHQQSLSVMVRWKTIRELIGEVVDFFRTYHK
jgi:hypothetical protein